MKPLSRKAIRLGLATIDESGESVAARVPCNPTVANRVIRIGAPAIGGAGSQTRRCAEEIADLLRKPFVKVWGVPDLRESKTSEAA